MQIQDKSLASDFYLRKQNWKLSEMNKTIKITSLLPHSIALCYVQHIQATSAVFFKMATYNRHLKRNKLERLQMTFWIYLFWMFAWRVALQESETAVLGKWNMTKVLWLLIYLIDALRLHNCISVILCFSFFFSVSSSYSAHI